MAQPLFGQPRAVVEAALPRREPVDCPICGVPPVPFAIDYQGFRLARCSRCGLELHSPRPPADDLARALYTDEYHRAHEATVSPVQRAMFGRQLDRLERLTGHRGDLLDVGCGAGAFLRFASERGWRVFGMDIVLSPLAAGSATGLWRGPLESIDFGDRKFAAVRFNQVLEHTPDPLVQLRRARELLDEGGVLLVAVPNLAGVSARIKSWQSRLGLKRHRWRHYAAVHHLWFFTPRTLARLMAVAGFGVTLRETPMPAPRGRFATAVTMYRRLLESWGLGSLLDIYAKAVPAP